MKIPTASWPGCGRCTNRSIKPDPKLRSLPVVIVSYRDRPEDRARGMEVRADAYLTKSDFQEHGFLDVVHGLIGDGEVSE